MASTHEQNEKLGICRTSMTQFFFIIFLKKLKISVFIAVKINVVIWVMIFRSLVGGYEHLWRNMHSLIKVCIEI